MPVNASRSIPNYESTCTNDNVKYFKLLKVSIFFLNNNFVSLPNLIIRYRQYFLYEMLTLSNEIGKQANNCCMRYCDSRSRRMVLHVSLEIITFSCLLVVLKSKTVYLWPINLKVYFSNDFCLNCI